MSKNGKTDPPSAQGAHADPREIEARLIEQDHRPWHVVSTFLRARREWEDGDPRRDAAVKAIVWRLFFSPLAIGAAGGADRRPRRWRSSYGRTC